MVTVLLIALWIWIFMAAVNLTVDQYDRGVARNAVDEGARAGAALGAGPAVCQARADQVLTSATPGPIKTYTKITCQAAGGQMVATAAVDLPSFVTLFPGWSFTVQGRSTVEAAP